MRRVRGLEWAGDVASGTSKAGPLGARARAPGEEWKEVEERGSVQRGRLQDLLMEGLWLRREEWKQE